MNYPDHSGDDEPENLSEERFRRRSRRAALAVACLVAAGVSARVGYEIDSITGPDSQIALGVNVITLCAAGSAIGLVIPTEHLDNLAESVRRRRLGADSDAPPDEGDTKTGDGP